MWKTEYIAVIPKYVIYAGQSASCDVLSIATFNPRFQTKLLKLNDKLVSENDSEAEKWNYT